MVAREFVPEAGDLVWVDFTPQAGREQAGRRPAVVLSPRGYNEKAGLAVVCPITSHSEGYPFEVALPPSGRVRGVILADHLKSLDWRQRNAQKGGKLPPLILATVLESISALLQIQ
ncbi:MAG: endoribonuclease MazF [Candidatus Acidiferrum sp.]